jgi:U4/U6 small nuclear ribonucleoprotein PRP31
MSTLADELLQDFEDSGSDREENSSHEFLNGDEGTSNQTPVGGRRRKSHSDDQNGGMELDDDESEVGDVDVDMLVGGNGEALENGDDEEEAKAKIEKMQLGGVDDVRSVAGLMKTLEPVLEVSKLSSLSPVLVSTRLEVYIFHARILVLTQSSSPCRKSHTFSRYHQINKLRPSAL